MNNKNYNMDINICQHDFENNENYYGAVTPPIVQTTLFSYKTYDEFISAITNERENYVYSRGVNPTTEILEKKLAELERGERAKVFASGMGAISATLFTLLKSGDHVLLVNNVYGPATSYCGVLEKYGVENSNVFVKEASEIEGYIKENTKLIYFESPSTQMMYMLDLDEISKIAKKHNILTMTDNTWATPLYQKPILHGIDIVVHSCTKYIGGHSDVLAGVVVSTNEIVDKIFEIGHQFSGAAISPMNAWLLIRGLRTLAARLEFQKKTTQEAIKMLQAHPAVIKINHPQCFEGTQKRLAEKYLSGYTSLLSIEINTDDLQKIKNVVDSCKLFQIGVSWGGYESLILPQYNGLNDKSLKKVNIPKTLIRIYLGLEDTELLVNDLKSALDTLI